MVRQSVLTGLLMAGLFGGHAGAGEQRALDRGRATFADGTSVTLEIADTEAKRNRGLMFRETLAENEGMLFVFDRPGAYGFWMQNCLIALDLLWLDDDFRVVSIARSVPPCRLPGCDPPCGSPACPTYAPDPGTSARYVIEVASGFAARHRLALGQPVTVALPGR